MTTAAAQEQSVDAGVDGTPGALEGLRVLDLGTTIAGPLTATLLGDLGAEVIKAERPDTGDTMREWAPHKDGVSLWWKVIARNKKLVTLDLRRPEGRDLALRLVAASDVVVENFRPGTMERWGLGYDELAARNPGIVMVRVSGYGQDGPYAHRPGYGTIAEAMTGIPAFTGFPETPPTLPAFPLADSVAATFAVMGTLAAVYRRAREERHEGQVVDVSLYEPLFRLAESLVIGYDQLGIVKQRLGNRLAEDSPRNVYETADGEWVAISASSDRTFERLAEAMGQPGLAADARFSSNRARIENADELDRLIAAWFRRRPLNGALEALDRHDVIAGPLYDIERVFDDVHYAARRTIVTVGDEDLGQVRMQNVTPRLSRTPGRVHTAGGRLGRDNDEVYGGLLGLDEAERGRLAQEAVI